MNIRVAEIGTGYFTQYHYNAWSKIPGVALETACIRGNEQRLREIEQAI